jgi:hypothetical protein
MTTGVGIARAIVPVAITPRMVALRYFFIEDLLIVWTEFPRNIM